MPDFDVDRRRVERTRGHLRTSMREGGKIMNAIDAITQDYLKKDIPDFGIGDTVRVQLRDRKSVV